jgi:hypothetical protein
MVTQKRLDTVAILKSDEAMTAEADTVIRIEVTFVSRWRR